MVLITVNCAVPEPGIAESGNGFSPSCLISARLCGQSLIALMHSGPRVPGIEAQLRPRDYGAANNSAIGTLTAKSGRLIRRHSPRQ